MRILSILLVLNLLVGCATQNGREKFMPPPLTPIQTHVNAETSVATTGSLYDPNSGFELYGNSRASRIGDVVMVKIVDNAKAENKVDTRLERNSQLSLGIDAFFGRDSVLGADVGGGLFGVKTNQKTEGKSNTKRENTLTATVATRVINVLPGGLLQIEGIRATQINNEVQYLVVKGIVRMRDIDAENSVLSTNLAEAVIGYYGKGDLSEQQRQGWGNKVINTVWPF